MKGLIFLTIFFFSTANNGHAQTDQGIKTSETPLPSAPTGYRKTPPSSSQQSENEPSEFRRDTAQVDEKAGKIVGLTPTGYVRPAAKRRFKRYVNNAVGPFALARYTATAGLLTWRNSPSEWGDKWEGFGRRFANVAGKGAIRSTTVYALDEAFKLDSTFYRSRDRSVPARLRNSVFSAVTARTKSGKRVIGVPRLAGGFAAEVVSSTTWYPSRYDYLHGLKGGAISVGINVGFNLLREFVWK